ncbi:MAG: hypothetical protein BGO98_44830 [Myxococcales bacterium 68-20]|nr:hypothetical protein [Myxococcales bacterium]OJY27038.1 MAG: hypothetical protein BGO98_44830 [Myxococcales bacterium 68-20]
MTVRSIATARPPSLESRGTEAAALARLARLEQALETSITACRTGSELVEETALTQAVAVVAHLFGAADRRMSARAQSAMADAYDACLQGLSGAWAGDSNSLVLALSAVRTIRISLAPRKPTPSTLPRAA